MMRFDGKVAVVTGAASGLGAATAKRLSAEGAKVVAVDRSEAGLAELSLNQPSLRIVADVADEAAIDDMVRQVVAKFEAVDLLVANAGIWRERNFLDMALAEWDETLNINLRGTFLVSQRVARAMVAGGRRGAIVATSSTNGFMAEPDTAHYNASKGGVLMLVKSMAVDLAEHGIRVNAVAPGVIRTPLNSAAIDAAADHFSFPPARRWGRAEDVAGAICYLLSDDADYVTGSALVIDGGQTTLNGSVRVS
ncbi:SDR family NAD(P)-dependent oxidoreductase [Dactylosporangium sp. CA-233914]|uniref:SDR family NAD(P)-dependent oxidoreductase n=1 Tax=Dactylosporangium sp. CA-233914 TaxID=3239934 RepID=UPI003D8B9149